MFYPSIYLIAVVFLIALAFFKWGNDWLVFQYDTFDIKLHHAAKRLAKRYFYIGVFFLLVATSLSVYEAHLASFGVGFVD